jgi:hypothetical protein
MNEFRSLRRDALITFAVVLAVVVLSIAGLVQRKHLREENIAMEETMSQLIDVIATLREENQTMKNAHDEGSEVIPCQDLDSWQGVPQWPRVRLRSDEARPPLQGLKSQKPVR